MADEGNATGDTSAITILGISLRWFVACFISLLVIIFLLIFGIKSLRGIIKRHREQYRRSEQYYFRYFKNVSKRKDPVKAVESLYRWIDQLDMDEPTFQYFATTYGTARLVREVKLLEQHINSNNTSALSVDSRAWSEARNNYLKGKRQTEGGGQILWINP